MPINIPPDLPAKSALEEENIFVITDDRAESQDIRPLQIAIVNLMPTKIATEVQLLRLLGNSPIQVDITLIKAENHVSKNASAIHMNRFYKTFSQIRDRKFDGMIITGAPVEHLPFEEVDYWDELKEIMDYSRTNVFSTFSICWGAQAALYHHFGIPKRDLKHKKFGVFAHHLKKRNCRLFRGFDDRFYTPHSRHTEVRSEDVAAVTSLEVLADSSEAGVCILQEKGCPRFYITGHMEYDADTLAREYFRDLEKGRDIAVPANYFPGDNPHNPPMATWRAHGHLLFNNWLNYYVYQETPFVLEDIGK